MKIRAYIKNADRIPSKFVSYPIDNNQYYPCIEGEGYATDSNPVIIHQGDQTIKVPWGNLFIVVQEEKTGEDKKSAIE